MISPEELFAALIHQNYIVYKDGNIIVTDNFYREFGDPSRFALKKQIDEKALAPIAPPTLGIVPAVQVETLPDSILVKFILDAQIPKAASTKTGSYALNKYNTKAEKILIKALKDKIDYGVLVMSAKIYYKSGVQPKTIANFFLEGIWKTEYADLAEELNKGNKEAQKYINSRVAEGKSNNEGSNRFKR